MKKFLFLLLPILLTGCASLNPLSAPAKGICKSVLPEYQSYVDNDANLTAEEKWVRTQNVKTFQKLVDEYVGQD